MQNEKLRILKMLENGQISATEAAQLLQAVGSAPGTYSEPSRPPLTSPPPPAPARAPYPPPSAHSFSPPPPAAPHPSSYGGYASNNRPPGATHDRVDDLSRKFESFAKEMAPKVHRFTETVADKIVSAADRVSGAFTEHAPPPGGQTHRTEAPRHSATPAGGMVEKNVELPVEVGGYNELSIGGLNADVRIKGFNSDKITASLKYRAKRPGAPIELMKLGGKYFLKYEPDDFHSVSIDAFVPERAFSVIKIEGVNGTVDCSSLAASEMRVTNANSATRIAGVAVENLVAESSGGHFKVSNVTALSAKIENLNGLMETEELDIANLKLSNYNNPLTMIMSKFERHADYTWVVETGNAKLTMNLPTLPDLGYHIKAHASMSEIRVGLTGLQFFINEPSFIEARSVNFDKATKRVKMTVETSNAPLSIN